MKKAAKLMVSAGILAASAAGTAYAVTKLLVDTALNREAPKIMRCLKKVIAGSKSVSQELLDARQSASDKLLNTPMETVTILADDGTSLIGRWYPAEHPQRVIIAMHGWRSVWCKDFGMIADFWHNSGCSILFPDQRGQNDSGGSYMGFGLLERHDCMAWIKWADARCDGALPIYLAGISMGATTVLMTAGDSFPKSVRGIIADCGFTSPDCIWRYVVKKNLHLPYGIRRSVANYLCKRKICQEPHSYSTIDALKKATVPVLFIHGSDDHFVPVEMTYQNFSACVSPKYLLIVPGASHGMSYIVNRKAYEEAVMNFFTAYDGITALETA